MSAINGYVSKQTKFTSSFNDLYNNVVSSKNKKKNSKLYLSQLREILFYYHHESSLLFDEKFLNSVVEISDSLTDQDVDRKILRTNIYLMVEIFISKKIRKLDVTQSYIPKIITWLSTEVATKTGLRQNLTWRAFGEISSMITSKNIREDVYYKMTKAITELKYPTKSKSKSVFGSGENKDYIPTLRLWAAMMSSLRRFGTPLNIEVKFSNIKNIVVAISSEYSILSQHALVALTNMITNVPIGSIVIFEITQMLLAKLQRDHKEGGINLIDPLNVSYLVRLIVSLTEKIDFENLEHAEAIVDVYYQMSKLLNVSSVKIFAEVTGLFICRKHSWKILNLLFSRYASNNNNSTSRSMDDDMSELSGESKMESAGFSILDIILKCLVSQLSIRITEENYILLPVLLRLCVSIGKFLISRPHVMDHHSTGSLPTIFNHEIIVKDGEHVIPLWLTLKRLLNKYLLQQKKCPGIATQIATETVQVIDKLNGVNHFHSGDVYQAACWTCEPGTSNDSFETAISNPHLYVELIKAFIWLAPDKRYCIEEHSQLWQSFTDTVLMRSVDIIIASCSEPVYTFSMPVKPMQDSNGSTITVAGTIDGFSTESIQREQGDTPVVSIATTPNALIMINNSEILLFQILEVFYDRVFRSIIDTRHPQDNFMFCSYDTLPLHPQDNSHHEKHNLVDDLLNSSFSKDQFIEDNLRTQFRSLHYHKIYVDSLLMLAKKIVLAIPCNKFIGALQQIWGWIACIAGCKLVDSGTDEKLKSIQSHASASLFDSICEFLVFAKNGHAKPFHLVAADLFGSLPAPSSCTGYSSLELYCWWTLSDNVMVWINHDLRKRLENMDYSILIRIIHILGQNIVNHFSTSSNQKISLNGLCTILRNALEYKMKHLNANNQKYIENVIWALRTEISNVYVACFGFYRLLGSEQYVHASSRFPEMMDKYGMKSFEDKIISLIESHQDVIFDKNRPPHEAPVDSLSGEVVQMSRYYLDFFIYNDTLPTDCIHRSANNSNPLNVAILMLLFEVVGLDVKNALYFNALSSLLPLSRLPRVMKVNFVDDFEYLKSFIPVKLIKSTTATIMKPSDASSVSSSIDYLFKSNDKRVLAPIDGDAVNQISTPSNKLFPTDAFDVKTSFKSAFERKKSGTAALFDFEASPVLMPTGMPKNAVATTPTTTAEPIAVAPFDAFGEAGDNLMPMAFNSTTKPTATTQQQPFDSFGILDLQAPTKSASVENAFNVASDQSIAFSGASNSVDPFGSGFGSATINAPSVHWESIESQSVPQDNQNPFSTSLINMNDQPVQSVFEDPWNTDQRSSFETNTFQSIESRSAVPKEQPHTDDWNSFTSTITDKKPAARKSIAPVLPPPKQQAGKVVAKKRGSAAYDLSGIVQTDQQPVNQGAPFDKMHDVNKSGLQDANDSTWTSTSIDNNSFASSASQWGWENNTTNANQSSAFDPSFAPSVPQTSSNLTSQGTYDPSITPPYYYPYQPQPQDFSAWVPPQNVTQPPSYNYPYNPQPYVHYPGYQSNPPYPYPYPYPPVQSNAPQTQLPNLDPQPAVPNKKDFFFNG